MLFIGHNGAGKTTTIRAVVGIMDFDEVEILVNGQFVDRTSLLNANPCSLYSRQSRLI